MKIQGMNLNTNINDENWTSRVNYSKSPKDVNENTLLSHRDTRPFRLEVKSELGDEESLGTESEITSIHTDLSN